MTRRPKAAGVYLRISQDRDGEGLGVERQRADCLDLAETRGWTVAEIYTDNDRSAFSGKPRPGYTKLLEDIAAGRIDGVIAWHTDRLHRRFRDLEPFVAAVEDAGISVATVKAGELDLGTASGRMLARMLAAADAHEVERKSERQKAKAREIARAGRPGGGGMRPFGYEANGLTIRPDEAEALQEAAHRLLAGESLYHVVEDWRVRGVRTSQGHAWSFRTLKRTLRNPRIAGLRAHGGEVFPAAWPAILPLEVFDEVQALLEPKVVWERRGRQTPYVLTGYLRCGKCGRPMYAHPNHGKRSYSCLKDMGGCGGIRIIAEPTEDVIAEAVFARIEAGGVESALEDAREQATGAALQQQLEADRASLERLVHDHYVERIVDRDDFMTAREDLRQRIDQAERRLAGIGPVSSLPPAESARAAWEANGDAWRRKLLAVLVERIDVAPMPAGRPFGFTSDRLSVRWRP